MGFFILFAWACSRLENPVQVKNIPEDGRAPATLQFTGSWQGKIDGVTPYFRGNPVLTMELIQIDSLVRGVIRTSDGAFKNDTLRAGSIRDSTLIFYARETDFYTGEILKFSGNLKNDTLSGSWYISNMDSAAWYAVRQ